jgi:hypothetical protein
VPSLRSAAPIHAQPFQRTPAVRRILQDAQVQAKLTIGAVDDPAEREADRVADQVMRMPEPVRQSTADGTVRRMCPDCEGELQRSASGGANSTASRASGAAEAAIGALGRGAPLPVSERAFFAPRFGRSFDNVRIHNGDNAAAAARAIGARAFTLGDDIAFATGEYRPGSAQGRRLIAHELTHTVQQETAAAARIQRAAIYTGPILDEGSCEHLACNSRWARVDTAGITCPDGTRNAFSTTHKKYSPSFTCDPNTGAPCADTGDWMAIPHSRFERRKCGQDLVICANHHFAHATVRDRSEGAHWEVSHGIQDALGLTAYATFTGSIYGGETAAGFSTDQRCR